MVLALALCVACSAEPSSPFTYRVEHVAGDGTPRSIKFEATFENFALALRSGPYAIELVESGVGETLYMSPGYCLRYSCTGPLVEEEIAVSLNPLYDDHVLGFECTGLDGGVNGGIDTLFLGDCEALAFDDSQYVR